MTYYLVLLPPTAAVSLSKSFPYLLKPSINLVFSSKVHSYLAWSASRRSSSEQFGFASYILKILLNWYLTCCSDRVPTASTMLPKSSPNWRMALTKRTYSSSVQSLTYSWMIGITSAS